MRDSPQEHEERFKLKKIEPRNGTEGHGDFRQGKSKKAKGKSEDSPMGWAVVLNVFFFCCQIALLLKLSRFGGYYTKMFDKKQIEKNKNPRTQELKNSRKEEFCLFKQAPPFVSG